MSAIYSVHIDNATPEQFYTFDSATRFWDRHTYQRNMTRGGIQIQEFNAEGDMIRDGWLIHVKPNGVVYINPNMIAITN